MSQQIEGLSVLGNFSRSWKGEHKNKIKIKQCNKQKKKTSEWQGLIKTQLCDKRRLLG